MANYVAVSLENARLFSEIENKNSEIAALNKRLEEKVELQEGKIQEMDYLLSDSQQELGKLYGFGNIVGQSAPMQNVFRILQKVSGTNATVLIQVKAAQAKS